jgi:hypothetical protein
VWLAAIAMAAAGCSGSPHGERRDQGAPQRVPELLRSADLRLPLEDYFPTVAETQRLARADRALLRQCMREFGIDFAAPDPPSLMGPRTWMERRYGLTDPTQATRGYWPQTRAAVARAGAARATTAAEAGQHRVPAEGLAEGDALTGTGARTINGRPVPAGGCAADARRRLAAHDPPGADPSLAQRLLSDTYFGSQRDARVRAATGEWSTCMAAAGYRYAGPLDPPKDARFQLPTAGPAEIEIAMADVACKQRTNLVGIWFTVEAAAQSPLIEANRAGLQLARTAFQAQLAVAAGVGA